MISDSYAITTAKILWGREQGDTKKHHYNNPSFERLLL
jgi:hypothetical protein